MAVYHCSTCGIEWPVAAVFSKDCPQCGEPTYYSLAGVPMEADEVARRCAEVEERKKREIELAKRRRDFEEFYVEHTVADFRAKMDAFANLDSWP